MSIAVSRGSNICSLALVSSQSVIQSVNQSVSLSVSRQSVGRSVSQSVRQSGCLSVKYGQSWFSLSFGQSFSQRILIPALNKTDGYYEKNSYFKLIIDWDKSTYFWGHGSRAEQGFLLAVARNYSLVKFYECSGFILFVLFRCRC